MLKDRIKEIETEFSELPDSFLRYSFLVELSAYVTDTPPELMVEENLFPGCQSRVWMMTTFQNGRLKLTATSDTLLIRGLLYVMMELYNDCTPQELLETPIDILALCKVTENFTSERSANIKRMQEFIRNAAIDYVKTS